jgi:hypothetical protein
MSASGTKLTSGYGHRSAQGEDRGLRIQAWRYSQQSAAPHRAQAETIIDGDYGHARGLGFCGTGSSGKFSEWHFFSYSSLSFLACALSD